MKGMTQFEKWLKNLHVKSELQEASSGQKKNSEWLYKIAHKMQSS